MSTREVRALRGPTKNTAIKAGLFISAGALVVGLGTVISTYGDLSAREEQKTAQAAFANLSTCLLGLDTTGQGVDDRMPVGPVPYDAAPTVCRSRDVHAAVLGRGQDATMTFLSENGWTSPVRAQVTENAPRAIPRPKAMEGPASTRGENFYELKGPKNNPDPNAVRSALRNAAEFGILGILGQSPPPDLFGSDGFGAASKAPKQGVADPPKLTCGNDSATLTSHKLSGSTVDITQLRCKPEGCDRKRASVMLNALKAMWMVTIRAPCSNQGAIQPIRVVATTTSSNSTLPSPLEI